MKGNIGTLGVISGNRETSISDITIENVNVKARDPKLSVEDKVKGVVLKNVTVNGKPFTLTDGSK